MPSPMPHAISRAMPALAAAFLCPAAHADLITVYVYDYEFSINPPGQPVVPATVDPGDTVLWLFLDSGHSSTAVPNQLENWDSGFIGVVGQTFEHTFTHPGVWWYYCFPHGQALPNGTAIGMASTITVTPVPSSLALLFAASAGFALRPRRREPALA